MDLEDIERKPRHAMTNTGVGGDLYYCIFSTLFWLDVFVKEERRIDQDMYINAIKWINL